MMEIAVPAGDLAKLNGRHDLSRARPVTLSPDSGCNTTDDVLLSQIDSNIRRGFPQCRPHEPNVLYKALIVCGGPSLEMTKHELIEEYWSGHKIVAVNGAYAWCLDNNLKPSAAVTLDAREFNARFVERPAPGCKYLLASQCHPRAFNHCKDRDTYIWHALGTGSEKEHDLLKEYYFKRFYPITLGTTVGVRVISLMRMLGFRDMDLFGFDSCWLDEAHHSYSQPENDMDGKISVWLRPKLSDGTIDDSRSEHFYCAAWHMKQVEDFQQLIRERGNMFRLNVHGPGLLAAILRTGANIQIDEDTAKEHGNGGRSMGLLQRG